MEIRHYWESVSWFFLAVAIATHSSPAAAQDQQQQDEQRAVAPSAEQEVTELQPASMAPPDAEELSQEITKTIVVTGSRIPRPNLSAVSPVTVVGQEEVKLEGATMAEELLNSLPQVAPSQGAFVSDVFGGTGGTATVDLRNLGPARTLVLINGRRMGPGDPGSPVPDINMIPTSLIQRVEVLTGGASSVYGSDAVAGVANFILDTRIKGLRVDGQASVYQHDNRNESGLREALIDSGLDYPAGNTVDGGRQDINVAYGRGFFDDQAHVTLYAGYRRLDALTQDSRDYSACPAEVNEQDNRRLACNLSAVSAPANFLTNFGIFTIGPNRTLARGLSLFNFTPWVYFQRPSRRWTAGGFVDAEISDAVKPYLELMYLDDRSVAQAAPTANFLNTRTINCDNPLLSDQQRSIVCSEGNFVADDNGNPIPFTDPVTGGQYFRGILFVARRNVEGGGRQAEFRHRSVRVVGGVKGELGSGITYDASYVYGRARVNSGLLGDFSITRLRRALDVVADPSTGEPVCRSALSGQDPACVPWDIFESGPVSRESLDYLSVPSFLRGAVEEQVANANATVDLGKWGVRIPWSGEAPTINFGAEYRKDSLDFEPDELAQSNDLAGNIPIVPVHGSADVKELFAEARIPLIAEGPVDSLALEGGYRQSWYDNGERNVATNAYKLALDLVAVRGLRLRASHQRAVRAPNVVELFSPPVGDFFLFDRCAGGAPQATQAQCALTGVSAAQYGLIQPSFLGGYNAISGGNPDLEPEKGITQAAGLVLQPAFLRGFNATLDWWRINLTGAVEQIGAQFVMDTCIATGDPIFCSRIHRDPNGSLWLTPQGFVDARLANIGSLKLRGVDVGADYRIGLGRFGAAAFSVLGSYLDKYRVDNGGLSEAQECAGRIGFVCTNPIPRWRHKARVTWESPNAFSVSLAWRFTGKMSPVPVLGIPPPGPLSRVKAQSFFDVATLVPVARSFVLRLGVRNIFDREPPVIPAGEGAFSLVNTYNGNTYPQWYDPLGRFFFAGFTANF